MATTTVHGPAAPATDKPLTLGRGRALLAMTRPSQLLLIAAVFGAGVLLGLGRPGVSTQPGTVLLVLLLVLGAGVAAHLVNEAEDAETDRLTARTSFSGGSGALEASGLEATVPRRLGLALAGTVAAGTWLAWMALPLPASAVTLVLVGLSGALCYSLPPVAAMRRGWGEPLNALLGGLLLPLAGVAAVTGSVGPADVLVFVPFTLAVLASVMATAWPDRRADARTGKATMQVRLKPPTLRRIHALVTVAFVVALGVAAVAAQTPLVLAGLLVLPAMVIGSATYTRRESPLPNVAAMVGLVLVMIIVNAAALLTP